jgi:hypothetical protein
LIKSPYRKLLKFDDESFEAKILDSEDVKQLIKKSGGFEN